MWPRNVLSYDFFWWFVFLGGPRTFSAWLTLRLLWAFFVICINPRWPPAMTKFNFGSNCRKTMGNTNRIGFVGLQSPFLVLLFHFGASIRILVILSNIWNVRVLYLTKDYLSCSVYWWYSSNTDILSSCHLYSVIWCLRYILFAQFT